ncbi:MAG: hypothetical protein NTW07_13645, partial [candidate division Zixibacteria bacterium]|nr:hypothetical protein [candidate division Zixibacteria bacterium]
MRSAYGSQLVDAVKSAVVIVSFFYALDYFTSKSSIEIRCIEGTQEARYELARIGSFYEDNKFSIPDTVTAGILKPLFRDEFHRLKGRPELTGSSTEQDLVKALELGYGQDWLPVHIRVIEKHFSDLHYSRRFLVFSGDSFYSQTQVDTVRARVRNLLSDREYYELMLSLMRSRIFDQQFAITNDGKTDLANISITIPAPVSRFDGLRSNTILGCTLLNLIPAVYEVLPDKAVLRIDRLRPGEGLLASITTREYALDTTEFLTTYDSTPVIRTSQLWLGFFLVLVIVFMLEI